MSDMLFQCTSCNRHLVVSGETVPITHKCSGCGASVPVPSPTIYFNCRSCRRGLWASSDVLGAEVTCPKCLGKITVPKHTKVTCVNCNSRLEVQDQPLSELVGQTATCPECKGDIRIPPLPHHSPPVTSALPVVQKPTGVKYGLTAVVTVAVVIAGFWFLKYRQPSAVEHAPRPVEAALPTPPAPAPTAAPAPVLEAPAPSPTVKTDTNGTPPAAATNVPPTASPVKRPAAKPRINPGESLPPPSLDADTNAAAIPAVPASGPFMTAAQDGDTAALGSAIAAGTSVNSPRETDGATALHIAVGSDNLALVRWLVDHGADVNARLKEKLETPMHLAMARKNIDVVRLLLQKGADVNATDARGYTPLMRGPGGKITGLMLVAGADAKARANDGYTPLHFAADAESASLLLQRGADPRAKANDGLTPLDLARDASQKFGESEVFRVLTVAK